MCLRQPIEEPLIDKVEIRIKQLNSYDYIVRQQECLAYLCFLCIRQGTYGVVYIIVTQFYFVCGVLTCHEL